MAQRQQTERVVTHVDAAEWKKYSCDIPIGDLHPTRFMLNVKSESIDLDGLELSPVAASQG